MAVALVVSTGAIGYGASPTTTPAIDTTGADFLVVGAHCWEASPDWVLSDSKGNTWQELTAYRENGGSGSAQLFYCYNPTVGMNHTFTLTSTQNYKTITVAAFSGMLTTSGVFDKENGNHNSSGTTITCGSITPAQSGELLIALYSDGYSSSSAKSIDSSFIKQEDQYNGNDMSGALAYRVYGDTAAINPTWTWTEQSCAHAAAIAAFKQAAGGSDTIKMIWTK